MKNYVYMFLATSILFFTGCDSYTVVEEQPHEQIDIPRPVNTEDIWHHTQYVNIDTSYETNISTPLISLYINFIKAISSDVKHFQIYIDSDNNPSTGFSGGQDHYEIIGADYMIEEGRLFKSTSTTAWTWSLNTCCSPTYTQETGVDGSLSIKSTFKNIAIFQDGIKARTINISIEPVNAQWQDTNNFVQTQTITVTP